MTGYWHKGHWLKVTDTFLNIAPETYSDVIRFCHSNRRFYCRRDWQANLADSMKNFDFICHFLCRSGKCIIPPTSRRLWSAHQAKEHCWVIVLRRWHIFVFLLLWFFAQEGDETGTGNDSTLSVLKSIFCLLFSTFPKPSGGVHESNHNLTYSNDLRFAKWFGLWCFSILIISKKRLACCFFSR